MNFLSGLLHGIGNLLDGGDDKKKKQQQQAVQKAAQQAPASAPAQSGSNQNNQPKTVVQPESMFSATTPLQKIQPKATPRVPNQPTVDANTLVKAKQFQQDNQPAPGAPGTLTPKQAAINLGGAPAGAALGVLRAGEGVVQGTVAAPATISHGLDWIANKLTGNKGNSRVTKALDTATQVVSKPVDALAKATDQAAGAFGAGAKTLYKPVQVAANVASLVPAAETVLSKVPSVTKKLGDLVDGSGLLKKVAPNRAASVAPETTGEIAPGLKSTNPTQTADAVNQIKSAEIASNPPVPVVPPPEPHPVSTGPANEVIDPQTAQQLGVQDGLLETPAYERQGKVLPSQSPDIAAINDGLHHNAAAVAAEPHAANMINEAFRATGGTDPLSLLMHTLSTSGNKADVRALVQRLVPEATGNTLNRAVNHITGADNIADVSQALTEAATRAKTVAPLGPLSDAPALPAETPPVASPEVAPTPLVEPMPAQAPAAAPPAEIPAIVPPDTVPAPTVAPPEPAAPVVPQIPDTAPIAGGPQVPEAPLTRQAAIQQIGTDTKKILGADTMRDVTNLDALEGAATGVIENLGPKDLVDVFGSSSIETLPNDAKGFAVIRAARNKLSDMNLADPANTDVTDALANTIDEMVKRSSGSGLLQRVVQEEFDKMPIQAKASYLAKKIDQANRDTKNYEPLVHDPARQLEVQAALTSRLQASQDVAERITGLEDTLNQAAEAARNGQKVNIKDVARQVGAARTELQIKNGELVKYFQTLVPGRTAAQKALVDWPKRMMLAGFSGRINDVLTTASNVGELQAQNLTQSVLAKGYNLVKGKGAVTDTGRGLTKVVTGLKSGLQKFAGEVRGNQYIDNVQKSVKNNDDLRSGLRKANGPVGRTIQAGTELATNLSEGVKNQKLYQLADQEAAKLGLKGSMRRQYASARAVTPSRQMVESANELKLQVNNLNDNPISRTLYKVGQALEGDNKFGKTGLGGIVKNQIIPFTSWLGGNIWNSVTEKNALAHTFKFLNDARRGDPENAIRHLAGAVNGAATGYAVGYQLAKAGVLTDKNAEGYNDGGLYVHAGNRYVPVGMFGFFAPNIVLGKAAHDGLNPPSGKNGAEVAAGVIGNFAWHGLALGNVLGTESGISKAQAAGTRPGGDATDAAAVATGSVVGQGIPAITGDINSFLDNGVPLVKGSDALNPTHEAANTRVQSTKILKSGVQSQAKDYKASTVASVKNRIPVVSQNLPRKAGVAAKDFFDRVVKGDRSTQTQQAAAVKAKTDAQVTADLKKRNIPDPNAQYKTGDSFDNAVENRVEKGKFDDAIEGLNAQLKKVKAGANVTTKQTDPIEEKIKQTQVLKEGKFDPKIRDTYKSTSVSEWRNMGDPSSDTYDPAAYQKLYAYDSALAAKGISGSTLKKTDNKFTAKTSKAKGGGSRAANAALKKITSNTIGTLPSLGNVSFGDLAPKKITDVKIPTIQQIKSGELIKKRAISVSKG